MRSAGLLAAGAALAALVFAGCSDGGGAAEPAPSPSSSPTASPTPTGPVEPTLPAEAEGDDAAAAEAFVRHYWAMVNYAQATGDLRGLQAMALPGCGACIGGAKAISEITDGGGRFDGGDTTVVKTTAEQYRAGPVRGFLVEVQTEVSPQTVSVPGRRDERYMGGESTSRFVVSRTEQGWKIAHWEELEP